MKQIKKYLGQTKELQTAVEDEQRAREEAREALERRAGGPDPRSPLVSNVDAASATLPWELHWLLVVRRLLVTL